MKNRGITLIALVISIIVLLILAGISIKTLSGDNGIIKNAGTAKENAEISEEKELIQTAIIQAMGKNKYGNLVQSELQLKIGSDTAKVYEDGDKFIVLFNSDRMYTVDREGNVEDSVSIYKASTRNLVTELSDASYGSEDKPYEIDSIEDLVDLSYKVNRITVGENGTLTYISNGNSFEDKYIILTKSLNFKLPLSYEDSTRKDYGDINGNGTVEELLTELTTGKGWIPIGAYGQDNTGVFKGSFNGKNYKISNLYINKTEEDTASALFGSIGQAASGKTTVIENLGVTGNIYCNSGWTAGITICATYGAKNIKNCYFDGKIENIKSNGYTAGIASNTGANCTIDRCYSKGKIKGMSYIAGIVAYASNSATILNCHNESNISLGNSVGGIVATGNGTISNCYNTGTIQGKGSNYHGAGGILGYR